MYGLIGYPIGHSFSARYFNDKFEREHIDQTYQLFPLRDITELPGLLDGHPDLNGLNVTIPYKSAVIPYLTELDGDARAIGAVNVIKIDRERGVMKGYNTDAIGFRHSLMPLLRPEMKSALVLGTGGASKAVAHVLRELGLTVTHVSRTPGKDTIGYGDLSREVMESHLVIVNTTPLGMWPNVDGCPDIPYRYLTPAHLCYDVVYNPEVTKFMTLASEHGARVKNGLDMLVGQAKAAWKIWSE